uniref:Uncharacterized protein n=1 Tax=Ciona savignyi TaxID=51511 RepID=H2Y886_CIOSA
MRFKDFFDNIFNSRFNEQPNRDVDRDDPCGDFEDCDCNEDFDDDFFEFSNDPFDHGGFNNLFTTMERMMSGFHGMNRLPAWSHGEGEM